MKADPLNLPGLTRMCQQYRRLRLLRLQTRKHFVDTDQRPLKNADAPVSLRAYLFPPPTTPSLNDATVECEMPIRKPRPRPPPKITVGLILEALGPAPKKKKKKPPVPQLVPTQPPELAPQYIVGDPALDASVGGNYAAIYPQLPPWPWAGEWGRSQLYESVQPMEGSVLPDVLSTGWQAEQQYIFPAEPALYAGVPTGIQPVQQYMYAPVLMPPTSLHQSTQAEVQYLPTISTPEEQESAAPTPTKSRSQNSEKTPGRRKKTRHQGGSSPVSENAITRVQRTYYQPQEDAAETVVYHVCAVCGGKRSRAYQRQHPIIAGKPISAGVCSRCIHGDTGAAEKKRNKTSQRRSPRQLDTYLADGRPSGHASRTGGRGEAWPSKASVRKSSNTQQSLDVPLDPFPERQARSFSTDSSTRLVREFENSRERPYERNRGETSGKGRNQNAIHSIAPFGSLSRKKPSGSGAKPPDASRRFQSGLVLGSERSDTTDTQRAREVRRKDAERRIASHARAFSHVPAGSIEKPYRLPTPPQVPAEPGYMYRQPAHNRMPTSIDVPADSVLEDEDTSSSESSSSTSSGSYDRSEPRTEAASTRLDDIRTQYRHIARPVAEDLVNQRSTADSVIVNIGQQRVHFGPASPSSGRERSYTGAGHQWPMTERGIQSRIQAPYQNGEHKSKGAESGHALIKSERLQVS